MLGVSSGAVTSQSMNRNVAMSQPPPPPAAVRRLLGDLEVSAVGYGAMALAGLYGETTSSAAMETLRSAIDRGVTFMDTADAYGEDGLVERLLAPLLRERRDEVQVATKWGMATNPAGPARRRQDTKWDTAVLVDGRPERARSALEASLRRLGVDTVDLWYLHWTDPAVPVEDSVGAMAELVREGKARHLGVCNTTADELRRAHATHPITALQSEWSLWSRGIEGEVLPVARELGVGVVPWAPLGNGFLAGTVAQVAERDFRTNLPRFRGENLRRNRRRFAPLADIAAEKGITPAQLALAWLLHQGADIVPIPGTRSPSRVAENAAAASVQLTEEDLKRIEQIAPPGAAVGPTLL
jgi:aryl-alcohol dehydrogenase-like predicted oxidoreductase